MLQSVLKFLLNSTNQHGVHSPFVFDLVTKCFYDKSRIPDYKTLADFRKSLLQNDAFIEVSDFGAGSRVFKSNRRQVSAIAKNAGISKKRAELLFRITRYFQPENILEIGTSVGLGTSALALGNPSAKIVTLEGCPETAAVAIKQFGDFGFGNIETRINEFQQQLETLNSKPLNLIYFDGNHSKVATLAYFETLLPTATNDSVWIFDDIHWSRDMEDAWAEIKTNPKVTVTIDTFQWGMVFFRREQVKQHFTIRV